MLAIFRQNLFLKLVSLLAAVLLYVYVQAERNPTISRMLIATVQIRNAPAGAAVDNPDAQIEVNATGPREYMDRLKDSDVVATADLRGVEPDATKTELIHAHVSAPTLPRDWQNAISFDPAVHTLKLRLIPEETRTFAVEARYPKDPPAGFRYDRADISPVSVRVAGRTDRLDRITGVVANAEPTQQGASVDGEFSVSARDASNNPVDGVSIEPATVRVRVPLVEAPSSKIVTVSVMWVDPPLPPYQLVAVTASPNQVKIFGKPERVNNIFTLTTEDIPTRDLTETRDVQAFLTIPPGLTVRDLDGHPITHVTVHFVIQKLAATTSQPVQPPGGTGPQHG